MALIKRHFSAHPARYVHFIVQITKYFLPTTLISLQFVGAGSSIYVHFIVQITNYFLPTTYYNYNFQVLRSSCFHSSFGICCPFWLEGKPLLRVEVSLIMIDLPDLLFVITAPRPHSFLILDPDHPLLTFTLIQLCQSDSN